VIFVGTGSVAGSGPRGVGGWKLLDSVFLHVAVGPGYPFPSWRDSFLLKCFPFVSLSALYPRVKCC
jgi:hypothetical protein